MSDTTAYEPISAVKSWGGITRFGHEREFAALFSPDKDEQVDYSVGLIFVTALLFTFFFVWTVAIVVLKCMGPYQVGFLSGYHFVKPDDVEKDRYRRPFWVRIAFLNCGVFVILFSVLLVTQGIGNLKTTAKEVGESNKDIQNLVKEANGIAATLVDIGESSVAIRDEVVSHLGNFCPGNPNLEQETGVDFDKIANEAIDKLDLLEDFIEGNVKDLQRDLTKVEDATETIDDVVEAVDVWDWQTLLFVVPLVSLSTLLIFGTFAVMMGASVKWYQCVTTNFFLPLFCVAITFCWVWCSFFGIIGVVNADVCSGGTTESPDGTIFSVLEKQNYNTDTLVYKAVRYYIQSCRTEFPFEFISDYEVDIDNARTSVDQVLTNMESVTVARLDSLCGAQSDFAAFQILMETMETNLQRLAGSAELSLRLLSCERISPIYTNALYEATCTYNMTGVTWVFSSLLVISISGLLMIMFRSSYLDVEYPEKAFYEDGECGEEGYEESEYVSPTFVDDDLEPNDSNSSAESNDPMLKDAPPAQAQGDGDDSYYEEEEAAQSRPDDDDGFRDEHNAGESAKSWEKIPVDASPYDRDVDGPPIADDDDVEVPADSYYHTKDL